MKTNTDKVDQAAAWLIFYPDHDYNFPNKRTLHIKLNLNKRLIKFLCTSKDL
jgi:hypothetical protein